MSGEEEKHQVLLQLIEFNRLNTTSKAVSEFPVYILIEQDRRVLELDHSHHTRGKLEVFLWELHSTIY